MFKLSDYTARFDMVGLKYDRPRITRVDTPRIFVTDSHSFRTDLVEDPRLPAPVVSHHLHYWLEEQPGSRSGTSERLGLKGTMRGPYPSTDVPGMNLTFAPLGSRRKSREGDQGPPDGQHRLRRPEPSGLLRQAPGQRRQVRCPAGTDRSLGLRPRH